eukprot:3875602-Karenia_brevis.AAC.1
MEALSRKSYTCISFGINLHKTQTKIWNLFETVKSAKTIGEAKKYATLWELREWAKGGSMYVFEAPEVSEKRG